MKRPSEIDNDICIAAVNEWFKENENTLNSRYHFYDDKDKEKFKNDLVEASRTEYLNSHSIAKNLDFDEDLVEEIIEDIESYLVHRRTTYENAVQKWAAEAPSKLPITEEYTRVAVAHDGDHITGIARLDPHYQKLAQILLYADGVSDPSDTPEKVFSNALVLNFEDVASIGNLTPEDSEKIEEFKSQRNRRQQKAIDNMAKFDAENKLYDEVKKYGNMPLEDAQALISSLNISIDDIPKLLAALATVGTHKHMISALQSQQAVSIA